MIEVQHLTKRYGRVTAVNDVSFRVERVENHPALAPRPDDANVAQETKLMRDGRLGDAELTGKVADTQLGPRQRIEDSHARRIAEDAKDFGQAVNGVRVKSGHMNKCSYVSTLACRPLGHWVLSPIVPVDSGPTLLIPA